MHSLDLDVENRIGIDALAALLEYVVSEALLICILDRVDLLEDGGVILELCKLRKIACVLSKLGADKLIKQACKSGVCGVEPTAMYYAVIHVGDDFKRQLTQEEVNENIRKSEKQCEEYFLGLGYKPVDFEIAEWSGVWFNSDSYYRIIKETEKAYLLGRVDNLKWRNCEITFWVPKKAITFKGGK